MIRDACKRPVAVRARVDGLLRGVARRAAIVAFVPNREIVDFIEAPTAAMLPGAAAFVRRRTDTGSARD
jgi:hypothetical protein